MSKWEAFLTGETAVEIGAAKYRFTRLIRKYAPAGGRLLETGFGTGKIAMLLADAGYDVTAIDLDAALVYGHFGQAAKKCGVKISRMDMFQTAFASASFDVVYHQGVLEHFADDMIVAALREAARVSRYVVFHVPNHRFRGHPFGDERLLRTSAWRRLIRSAGIDLVEEAGDQPNPLFHLIVPHAFYTRTFIERMFDTQSWMLCRSSIFVGRSSVAKPSSRA